MATFDVFNLVGNSTMNCFDFNVYAFELLNKKPLDNIKNLYRFLKNNKYRLIINID